MDSAVTAPARHPLDVGTQQLLERALERRFQPLSPRERAVHGGLAVAFLLAAGALAVFAPADRALDPAAALALVGAYALLSTAEFSTGAGYAVPAQVIFVPMLLLLPTPLVPLLVAGALVLASGVQALRGRLAPERILLSLADAWFSLAPALVLVLAGAQRPAWSDWCIYLLALALQFAADSVISIARARAVLGSAPPALLRELRWTYTVDALLAPVGLLAAFAGAEQPYAPVLLLPVAALFLASAHEREERVNRTLELSRAYRGTALLLSDVVQEDDPYTGRHTEDVLELVAELAEELRVDDETRRVTELGALLHDVGKIAIPNEVIRKPGPLDADEWALMRTHTVEGQRLLERVGGLLAAVGRVVRASHERWDGRGYPDGLSGPEIPLPARIISACDAYSAMTTDRPYRRARSVQVAIAELRDHAGSQFDPVVVDGLLSVLERHAAPASRAPPARNGAARPLS